MNAAMHWNTPSVTSSDPRGLAVRQIAYQRNLTVLEPFITRQTFDVIGRLIEQRDARLTNTSRPNLSTIYSLSGQPVNVDSVDAGERTSLAGLAGEILQRWDGRGNHWRSTYDNQLRLLSLEERDQGVVDAYTYATSLSDPSHNLRGQMIHQTDPSGALEFSSFSLKGQPLRDSRTITDAGTFASSRTYNAHGALLTQTDAGDHQQRVRYDIVGQLQQVQLRIKGQLNWQPVLKDAQYNAAGQIIEQCAGNDVLSTWTYDPADGRLGTQRAQKNPEPALQDFEYFYDCVGNITRIEDHAFQPIYFANQLIAGHRDFTYDSLYRLTSATGHDAPPGSDLPGRPLPSDPNNHLNYKQRYEYNESGSLIKLTHERAVGGYTHEMFIDPTSNRGVRWKEADPSPDFDSLFDRHGNQQVSAPGRPLHWNSRDQLASATLVEREDGRNDEEVFRYSQGVRVVKRHETHTSSTTHFHQVIYLPGLEIRARDNGEMLHVITLPGGSGSVRCLHWVSKKPGKIDQDQLRYTLDDHLGSCLMELDQDASLISHEGYYPFGGTAWLKAASLLKVDYKTIRYSGKEMDECGLYYYGARYYAPWLQRWVSADPTGAVDGLNLYGFVGNNPLNYFDDQGESKTPSELKSEIVSGFKFLSRVHYEMKTLEKQLDDLSEPMAFRLNILKNIIYQLGKIPVGWFTSFHAAGAVGGAFPDFSNANPHSSGALSGMLFGNKVADESTGIYEKLMSPLKLNTPVVPDPSAFSANTLKEQAGLTTTSSPFFHTPTGDELIENSNTLVSRTVGAYIPAVGEAFAIAKVAEDGNRAEEGLFNQELDEIESTLGQLREATLDVVAGINANFAKLGVREFYDESNHGANFVTDLLTRRVGTTKARMVRNSTLQSFKERALSDIDATTVTLKRYRHYVTQKVSNKAA